MASAAAHVLGRYVSRVPLALFRIQGGAGGRVRLRKEATQKAAGRTPFDIKEHEGFVLPAIAAETRYMGPNGMRLLPAGPECAVYYSLAFPGPKVIFEIPAGSAIPPELVLLHVKYEHGEFYSLQPAERMTSTRLNKYLANFLAQQGVVKYTTETDFYKEHPAMHPLVVGFSRNA